MNVHKIVIPTPYPVGDVNAFLVKGDALSLFDAGIKTPEAYQAIERGIQDAGYTMKDVEQVIFTHQHPDHIGWGDAFPHAERLAHPFVDKWIRKEQSFIDYYTSFFHTVFQPHQLPIAMIEKIIELQMDKELVSTMPLTNFLNDGDVVPGHPNLRAYFTPGHSQCHLIFVDEQKGEAITGDLLLSYASSNPIIEPPADLSMTRPRAMLQYMKSLQLLHDLQLRKLYVGHGDEITDVNAVLTKHYAKHQLHEQKILALLDGPKTAITLVRELVPKAQSAMLGVMFYETLGKLDVLEHHGKVKVNNQDGIFFYEKC